MVNSVIRCLPPLKTKLDQTWIPVIPIAIPMRCKLDADSEGIFALGGDNQRAVPTRLSDVSCNYAAVGVTSVQSSKGRPCAHQAMLAGEALGPASPGLRPSRPRILHRVLPEMLPASNFVCEFGECVRPTCHIYGGSARRHCTRYAHTRICTMMCRNSARRLCTWHCFAFGSVREFLETIILMPHTKSFDSANV